MNIDELIEYKDLYYDNHNSDNINSLSGIIGDILSINPDIIIDINGEDYTLLGYVIRLLDMSRSQDYIRVMEKIIKKIINAVDVNVILENEKTALELLFDRLFPLDGDTQDLYHQILCKSMLMNLLPTFIDNGLIVGDNNRVLFNTCIYYSTHTNVLNYLLSNGFDPNIQNIDGDTPLIMSAIYNCSYNVKLLLEHNVDPFIKNNNGENVYDIVLQLERDYDFVNNGEYLNFCSENGVGFLSEYLYIYMIL